MFDDVLIESGGRDKHKGTWFTALVSAIIHIAIIGAIVAAGLYVKKNPEIVKHFLMGISEGIHAFRADKEDALKYTATFLKSQPGPALSRAYDIFTAKVYPVIPRPTLKGIALVLAEMKKTVPAAATAKPEQLVDTTPLDQLEREGFFAKLK